MYYRGCWHMYWPWLLFKFYHFSNSRKNFTVKKTFFITISSLGHAFAYCPIFLTAAWSEGLFSSPLWLILLSNQLEIIGSRYHKKTKIPNPQCNHQTAVLKNRKVWIFYYNSLSLLSLADLGDISATKGMRTTLHSTQQWGILGNMRKRDPANWW